MKMKKSEYTRRLRANAGASEDAAEIAAMVAEEAGVEWAPEEVELPARVRFFPGIRGDRRAYLAPVDHDGVGQPGRDEEERILREAEARYNAVENILTHDEGLIHTDHVGRILRLERERLS